MTHMQSAVLWFAKRQLLGGDDEEEDPSACPSNRDDYSQADNIVGNATLHQVFTYTAAASTAIAVIVAGYMILSQMRNYREPRIQKHLIRVILTGPVFAVLSFIGVASYRATHYMEALLSLYEVFTLYSLFMLCVEMLAPAADWKSQLILMQSRSIFPFKSFRRKYFRVVQVIPVTFICTLATIISTARECWMNQESRRLIGIVSIIGAISILMAISGILPFVTRHTSMLKKVDPQIVNKLLGAKVIIVAEIILSLVFSILSWTDTFNPSATVSYNDIHVGILVFGTNCLAFITVFLMLPFYRPNQFTQPPWIAAPGDGHWMEAGNTSNDNIKPDEHGANLLPRKSREPSPKQSPLRAVLDIINPFDVIAAVWRGVMLMFGRPNLNSAVNNRGAYTPVTQGGQELPSYGRR